MFSLQLPEEMDYHLQMASASRGLSKGEYTRLALAVALGSEPVVTVEHIRNMRKLSALAARQNDADKVPA